MMLTDSGQPAAYVTRSSSVIPVSENMSSNGGHIPYSWIFSLYCNYFDCIILLVLQFIVRLEYEYFKFILIVII